MRGRIFIGTVFVPIETCRLECDSALPIREPLAGLAMFAAALGWGRRAPDDSNEPLFLEFDLRGGPAFLTEISSLQCPAFSVAHKKILRWNRV
jgi:hypothetical protein